MKRRIAAIVVAMSMLAARGTAFAGIEAAGALDDKVLEVNGDMTIEEGAAENIDAPKQAEIRKQKELEVERIASMTKGTKDVSLSVTAYKQEKTYWCGPATVKQIIKYLNGSANSQSYYAAGLGTTTAGTDMTVIDDYLAGKTGENYICFSISNLSLSSYMNYIWYGMYNLVPAVLDIDTTNISQFPYMTTGHYVNTSGYKDTVTPNKLRITDPHYIYWGNSWYDAINVYNANKQHWRHAIIY